MQKHTPGMFLTDFHMQKYTRGIISQVGIFLTVTPAQVNMSCLKLALSSPIWRIHVWQDMHVE